MVETVPHPRAVLGGLLGEDGLDVVGVEVPEVDERARGVDLGLEAGLGLAQHGGGVDAVAPGPGQQGGGPQKDGGALLPREGGPLGPSGLGGIDRLVHELRRGDVDAGQDVAVVAGHGHRQDVVGVDVLAADDTGDVDHLGGALGERGLEGGPLGGAGGVGADRLVAGSGNGEHAGGHGSLAG